MIIDAPVHRITLIFASEWVEGMLWEDLLILVISLSWEPLKSLEALRELVGRDGPDRALDGPCSAMDTT